MFERTLPLVLAMVQPPPLPGSYRHSGTPFSEVLTETMKEVGKLIELGFDGVILQNMNDMPVKQHAKPEAIAYMARLGAEIRRTYPQSVLGVLVNWDGAASLAVAEAAEADFIRVEHLFTRAEVTSAGIIEAQCLEIAEMKKRIGSKMPVYADIYEAHGVHIAPLPIEDAAWEAVHEAFADGLFISGASDDERIENIRKVRKKVGNIPCFLGGGATAANVTRLLREYDGLSAATWIKNGDMKNPVDFERAAELLENARKARR